MARVILVRVGQSIPVLFGATFVAFLVLNVLPGNVVDSILGQDYTAHAAALLTAQLHLNQPVIIRYFEWLGGALHGNFGHSVVTQQSVGSALWQAAPPTVELIIGGQIFGLALGLGLALIAVTSPLRFADKVATGVSLYGISVPSFVTGLMLILLFSVHWHLAPSLGWEDPSSHGWAANLGAMVMPSLTLGVSICPGYMRVFRREMYDQLEREEYVILARMKGISYWRLLFRHVARNASFGVITLFGLSTGLLIGSAVIIEEIFGIPGIGSLLLTAIGNRDSTMVEGCIVVIAVAVVGMNLVADLLYTAFDPRVRRASET